MNPQRYRQIKEVFAAAAGHGPNSRGEYLARACGGDAELQAEVESLLDHDQAASDFIEESAFEVAARLMADGDVTSFEGRRLGPYKLLHEIGRGGMGVVYLAERDDQRFHHTVAVKVVKRGLDTDDILRRFRNERQILASLNHPNIARLFDGGETEDGLPYFVMEYVEGIPLLKFCDEQGLATDGRLRLFRTICSAVQHAHQNLVVHRDLKPNNVLVTKEGTVKLLDFGVAKLLKADSTGGAPTMTRATERVMTPEYASPEQVRGQRITTSTDVYSLGVVLYELLTGVKPYNLTDKSTEEQSRAICESEPTKPSEAVRDTRTPNQGSAEKEVAASRNRRVSASGLKGDLDNIVLMALRKEPARRYKSVEQFSEDIRRHLAGLPVIARKDTFAYHASKFIARNRIAVTAASLIALAIITGLIVALWQAQVARRQRDLAQSEKLKAERINQFLQRMLSFSNQSITSVSPVEQSRNVTVNEMLDQITPQVETELSNQPDVRAQVLRTIGSAYASQGRYHEAEKNLRVALDAQTRLYGEESTETAATMTELGVLSYRQYRFDEASRLLQKAVGFYRKQQEAKSPEYRGAQFAHALQHFGVVKFYQGDAKGSLSLLNEALQIAAGANLQGAERLVLASIKTNFGGALISLGDVAKGEPLLRESLAEFRQTSNQPRWEYGTTLMLLGIAAISKHQPREAEELLRESEQIYRQTLGDNNIYLAGTLDRRAAALLLTGDLKMAEEKARSSLAMSQKISPNVKLAWVNPMSTLGDILLKTGRPGEGEEYYQQALAICEEQETKNFSLIVPLKIRLSGALLAQNALPKAERIAIEARDEARQHLGEQSPVTKAATDNLTHVYDKQAKHH